MNTDMISNVSSPPRAPLPEVTSVTRQTVDAAKLPEASKPDTTAENQNAKAPSIQDVKQAVEKISNFIASRQSELSFSIDNVTGSQIVKITDTQTKQVIRQFPSEEAVAIAHALDKLQGLLIKDKA